MRGWLLKNPANRGAYLGAVLLIVGRGVPLVCFSQQVQRGLGPDVLRWGGLLWLCGGVFWGAILGRGAGRAYSAWCGGDCASAREICLEVGVWCLTLILCWMLCIPMLVKVWSGGMIEVGFPFFVLVYPFTNICLQASGVMILAGLLLSRRGRPDVQLSEDRRL